MQVECTQCGAKLEPHREEIFYGCPYCHCTLYIERGKGLQHFYVDKKVSKRDLKSILTTWHSANELHEDVSMVSADLTYFPFWYFQFGGTDNHLIPANSSEVEEVNRIGLPPVSLLPFTSKGVGGAGLVEPQFIHDISLEKVVKSTGSSPDQLVSSSLIHLPLWTVAYTYGTDPAIYTAVVEGTSGAVYANVIPAAPLKKLRTAYYSLAYGSLAIFIAAGLLSPNLWWKIGTYVVLVPTVFFVGKAVIDRHG